MNSKEIIDIALNFSFFGLGDHLLSTAALKQLYKKTNRRLIIVSHYPNLFEQEEYCYRSFHYSIFAFEDILKNLENIGNIYNFNYITKNYLLNNVHVTEAYCENLNLPLSKNFGLKFLEKEEEFFKKRFNFNKPFIYFDLGNTDIDPALNESYWYKKNCDLMYQNKLFNILKNEYKDYVILTPTDTIKLGGRSFVWFIQQCKSFISIDTAVSHICENVKKGLVLWNNETYIKKWGHEYHKNILSPVTKLSPNINIDEIIEEFKLIIKD